MENHYRITVERARAMGPGTDLGAQILSSVEFYESRPLGVAIVALYRCTSTFLVAVSRGIHRSAATVTRFWLTQISQSYTGVL